MKFVFTVESGMYVTRIVLNRNYEHHFMGFNNHFRVVTAFNSKGMVVSSTQMMERATALYLRIGSSVTDANMEADSGLRSAHRRSVRALLKNPKYVTGPE